MAEIKIFILRMYSHYSFMGFFLRGLSVGCIKYPGNTFISFWHFLSFFWEFLAYRKRCSMIDFPVILLHNQGYIHAFNDDNPIIVVFFQVYTPQIHTHWSARYLRTGKKKKRHGKRCSETTVDQNNMRTPSSQYPFLYILLSHCLA